MSILADADAVVDRHMREMQLYDQIWQFPVVLLPFGASAGSQVPLARECVRHTLKNAHTRT